MKNINRKKLNLLQNQKEAYRSYLIKSHKNEKRLKTMIITNSILVVLLRITDNIQYLMNANRSGSHNVFCSFIICSSENDYYDIFNILSSMIQFFILFF